MGVNVLGVAHGVAVFGPLLVEAGEGHIVDTASSEIQAIRWMST